MSDDRTRARSGSGSATRVARVLIVDDDKLIGESLRRLLSGEFDVTVATDPTEALRRLVSGDWYDVILCDVMMPTMTGADLRNQVHAASPELAARIVFVTGGILLNRVRQQLDPLPNTVLAKPIDYAALRELIRRRTASTPPPRRGSQP